MTDNNTHTALGEKAVALPHKEGGALRRALFPEFYRRGAHRKTELMHDILVFGIALLFARTHFLFGMDPFAIAYLAGRRSRTVPAAVGAILGALSIGGAGTIFAMAYLFLLALRLVFSYPAPGRVLFPLTDALFGERALLRVLAATLTGAALGAYELAVSGPVRYALYFAATAVLAPALLTFLLSGVFDTPLTAADLLGQETEPRGRSYGRVRPAFAELSILTLLLSVGFSLRALSLLGLSLSTLFAVGATLFTARRFGAARAGIVGLFMGLLGQVTLAPAFAILGLLGGLLFPFGTVYGCLGGLLGAIAFAGYVEGVSGFLAVTPEGAVAVLFLFPTLRRLEAEPDPAAAELSRRNLQAAAVRTATPQRETGDHLGRLSRAFSELSALFFRLSDEEKRPAAAEYLVECQKVCARYCATCSNRVRCWEQGERVAERAVYSLSATLRERGRISREDLPPALRSGCRRIEEILDEIRDECAAMTLSHHRSDRNEFLSHDYTMLAKLLSEAARIDREEEAEDKPAEERMLAALGAGGGLSVAVLGKRHKRVAVGALQRDRLAAIKDTLCRVAEQATGCAMSAPLEGVTDGVATLSLESVRRYTVKTATCSVPLSCAGSGDRLRFFETGEDHFYAVLSDGMGSGADAGAVAEVSVDFLETMLKAGTSSAVSLQMLNNLVRTRRAECSATVDLFVFDLLHGDATFLKSGAAPSYIKRGAEIFRVRSRTMPLGLCRTPDTERINVEVHPHDVLIMLSDGIVPDNEDPAWLLSLLAAEGAEDLDALATRIVAEAVSRLPAPTDDITVGLIRLDPAEEVSEAPA